MSTASGLARKRGVTKPAADHPWRGDGKTPNEGAGIPILPAPGIWQDPNPDNTDRFAGSISSETARRLASGSLSWDDVIG